MNDVIIICILYMWELKLQEVKIFVKASHIVSIWIKWCLILKPIFKDWL